jgi:hypothetical protein
LTAAYYKASHIDVTKPKRTRKEKFTAFVAIAEIHCKQGRTASSSSGRVDGTHCRERFLIGGLLTQATANAPGLVGIAEPSRQKFVERIYQLDEQDATLSRIGNYV